MIRSALDPAGPQAAHIAALWWFMLWVSVAVLTLVTLALLIALFRSAARTSDSAAATIPEPPPDRRTGMIVGICVAATGIILMVFLTASVVTGHRIARLASDQGLTIKLTGYRWWWKVE